MKRTKEENAEKYAQLRKLSQQIARMTEEEQRTVIERFGAVVTCEGRPLSRHNTMMLLMQSEMPLAQVGGFKQWTKVGRVVKKGEHACGMINVPCTKKGTDELTGQEVEKTYFRLIPVFDITQTQEIETEAAA